MILRIEKYFSEEVDEWKKNEQNGKQGSPSGPNGIKNFNPGIFRDGILPNPGIPGFFGTGLTYFFHPGIDGIPGFFGTGLALYFYPGIFWKNLVQKPIKVFEIMVLFDI